MLWRTEVRTCRCGDAFRPKREAQRHCSERCRDLDKKHRKRSGDREAPLSRVLRSGDSGLTDAPKASRAHPENIIGTEPISYGWGKKGDPVASGDDYSLEYYDDGYPKLPICLDRRSHQFVEAA